MTVLTAANFSCSCFNLAAFSTCCLLCSLSCNLFSLNASLDTFSSSLSSKVASSSQLQVTSSLHASNSSVSYQYKSFVTVQDDPCMVQ